MLPRYIEPAVEDRRDQLQSEAVSGNEARARETQIAGKSRGWGGRGWGKRSAGECGQIESIGVAGYQFCFSYN